ncbi:MAG: c-type cytochrome, partial [Bacteroidota bacterium]|nr:c-type cytochrome [Bacteroidota bacterium]
DKSLLERASVEELVKALGNTNIWWRRNAQRLLLDKKDLSAIPLLKNMINNDPFAPARLHALWALEGLGKLEISEIEAALKDPEAGIRLNAIKLAELHLNNYPALANALLELQAEPDAKVRFQLLCTLGEIDNGEATQLRNDILFKDIEDEWVHLAALSSPFTDPAKLLYKTLELYAANKSQGSTSLMKQLGASIGNRNQPEEIKMVINVVYANPQSEGAAASLEGLAKGMRGRNYDKKKFLKEREMLLQAFLSNNPEMRKGSLQLLQILSLPEGNLKENILKQSFAIASNPQADAALRADAIELISLDDLSKYIREVKSFINPEEPALVQHAAIKSLALTPGTEVSEFLLLRWKSLTPEIRDLGVDVFMKDNARKALLLNGVEQGIVQPSTIGWRRTVALMNDWNDDIRAQARDLLEEKPGAREEIVKKYETALHLKGNAENGNLIFQKSCALCHQMGGKEGNAFGPDLSTLRNRKPESIMQDILIPNRSLADGYELWEVREKDGRISSGIIAHETANAITLRNIGGSEITVSRDKIASLEASKVSAMPPGLENQINEQEMADLLAFIKGL